MMITELRKLRLGSVSARNGMQGAWRCGRNGTARCTFFGPISQLFFRLTMQIASSEVTFRGVCRPRRS